MKSILLLFVCFSGVCNVSGQNIYKTESSKVTFFSDALVEDIEATTHKSTAVMNISSGEIAVLIPIKSFEFDKSLMQDHFNENYMESDKFPNSTFKGKIIEKVVLAPGETLLINISGELVIHGVTQHRDIPVTLKANTNGIISVTGKFNIKVADHNVKVPSLVFKNIAEVVEVSFEYTLKNGIHP
jgi:polyisoprenoid-binding protein YceI